MKSIFSIINKQFQKIDQHIFFNFLFFHYKIIENDTIEEFLNENLSSFGIHGLNKRIDNKLIFILFFFFF